MTKRSLIRVIAVILIVLAQPARLAHADPSPVTTTPIEHFVVLMQSNHSFDNYFGTYPGAEGIPAQTCMRLNSNKSSLDGCVKPFRLGKETAHDLTHGPAMQDAQYNRGQMNGFVAAYRDKGLDGTRAMGFYDGADLPYYWNIADRFTLFDQFFSSARTGSHLNHFYWVAGVPTPNGAEQVPPGGYGDIPTIFDRLEARGVSWKFYVENYDPHVTLRTPGSGALAGQPARVPLLNYQRFLDNPALFGKIADLSEYYTDLKNGTLPAVAYVVPAGSSENPPSRVQAGQNLVRSMTSDLVKSRYWSSSAFLWTYDGWGGWYDHVAPPNVDAFGYGFRVPALLVSAYSRRGQVNHTELDYTAILKFIESNWLLDPLGDRDARSPGLDSAFDFTIARPPELVGTTRVTTAPAGHAAAVVYLTYGAGALFAAACAFGVRYAGRPTRQHRRRSDEEQP
jgi:phospholipase C